MLARGIQELQAEEASTSGARCEVLRGRSWKSSCAGAKELPRVCLKGELNIKAAGSGLAALLNQRCGYWFGKGCKLGPWTAGMNTEEPHWDGRGKDEV